MDRVPQPLSPLLLFTVPVKCLTLLPSATRKISSFFFFFPPQSSQNNPGKLKTKKINS